eukprot:gene11979-biopygen378
MPARKKRAPGKDHNSLSHGWAQAHRLAIFAAVAASCAPCRHTMLPVRPFPACQANDPDPACANIRATRAPTGAQHLKTGVTGGLSSEAMQLWCGRIWMGPPTDFVFFLLVWSVRQFSDLARGWCKETFFATSWGMHGRVVNNDVQGVWNWNDQFE